MNSFCPPRHQTQRIELDLTPKQIEQLREVIDRLPLNRYAPLIVAVLPKLPLDSAATAEPLSAGDGSPAVRGPGFFRAVQ